ncbi:hypothetical protein SFRURICE_001263, partial [Spodoptera frugiperda]
MSDTELKDLRRQRGSIKARLTNFKNYLSEFRYEDPSISKQQFLELKLRLGKIESLFNDYDHVQNKIELLDSAEEINSDRDVTESLFYTQISLDSATSIKWEEYRNSLKDTPTLDNFYNFLRNHANVLEMVQASHGDKHNSTKEKTKEKVFHSEKSNKLFVAAACQDNPSKPKARSCLIC